MRVAPRDTPILLIQPRIQQTFFFSVGLQINLVPFLADLKVQYKTNNAKDGKLLVE